ncbi:Ltp family lipoprotein [Mycobacterium sp. LTG2003]
MNMKHLTVLLATALVAVSGVAAGGAQAATQPDKQVSGFSFEPAFPLSPVSRQNAVRAAEQYLDFSAFSRQGLIQQLEYDEFSTDDATFAVDHINVDWNEQAAKAAEQYLNFSAFSRGALLDQLAYDGFTPAQAAYGVTAAGL